MYYRASVPENSQIDTPILSVLARDSDKNRTITYTLEGDLTVLALVKVDRLTGQVSVKNRIDRELVSWLNFTGRGPMMSVHLVQYSRRI